MVDVVMFLPKNIIKKTNYPSKKMWMRKIAQYGGDVVMFVPNKIIKK